MSNARILPLLALAGAIVAAQGTSQATGEVSTFAGNAQHTGVFEPPATDLNAIRWSTTIDRRQTFTNTHYGSPLATAANTLIVPVKTEGDGFQIKMFDGRTGEEQGGTIDTDYVLPSHNWIPVYQPVLTTVRDSSTGPVRQRRLYYAGAGGTLFYVINPDHRKGRPIRVAFYGLDAFERDKAAFTSSVFVNTPLTADSVGNVYFGFRVQGSAPAPLSTTQSGFARIAPDGNGIYVLAGSAAADVAITRDTHNSAPALSRDERIVYVVAKSGTTTSYAYLLGLDTATLETRFKVFLKDPRNNRANNATVSDDSTASPMVGPDSDVYFGVLANPNNGSRGFLLHFSADLATEKTPGAFGWDSTPAIVPSSMLPSDFSGPSYLIFTKYNNYRFNDGDGVNRIALLDPNGKQTDPHATAGGLQVMREVITVIGPTPDGPNITPAFPHSVREWCINTAAVNPATNSVFVPNEDGRIYRWDLKTNTLSQAVELTAGFGEPYVPTIIGPDGTVFTLNGGTLFAVGTKGGVVLTTTSSKPDTRTVVAGDELTFKASARGQGLFSWTITSGTVIFTDSYYPVSVATPVKSELARIPMAGAKASFTTSGLAAGTHLITATHVESGAKTMLVQKVHAFGTTISPALQNPQPPGVTVVVTVSAAVGVPTGMVQAALKMPGKPPITPSVQLPLDANGTITFGFTYSLGPELAFLYHSDPVYASSSWQPGDSVVSIQQIAEAAKKRAFFFPPTHEARHR